MKNPVVFASTWITPEAHYRLPLRILPEKNPTSLNTDFSFFRGHYRPTGIHETNSDVKKFTMCVGVKKNVYFLFFLFFFFLPIWNIAQIIYLDGGQEKERLAKTTTSQTLISFRPQLK